MSPEFTRRAWLVLGGIMTALFAAIVAVMWLDLLAPPRDLATLLNTPAPPRSPEPTATPTTIPPTPHAVLSDDFTTTVNWPQDSPDNLFYFTPDGYILSPPPGGFASPLLAGYADTTSRNISIEVQARPVTATIPVEYGVVFWHSIDQNNRERFLAVSLSTDGTYRLSAHLPPSGVGVTATPPATPAADRWINLLPPARSVAINTDGQPNRLRVDVHPGRVLVFINDVLTSDMHILALDDYRNFPGFDGRVGLIAFSQGEPNQVLFTHFALYADVSP